ncbi:hypothetical protein BpHYR1_014886 [Brachionus plicatilis]|uniref:BED-type domain-containing protein n=1 Tax=Brachionus plicatilis TaxID=10195 RepID=A0A3M7S1Q9_BRAPC|nr:hypothetical protein BpHYR1_014886 [Brachionus plicatilis]
MTSELALLLSPGSNRKNEERRNTSHVWQHMKKNFWTKKKVCVYENCSKVYAESTSTSRVVANHLKVEHNVIKPPFEDSDSEFENITSPKVIRVLDTFSINDKTLSVTTDIASNMVCFGEMFCCANENRMHIEYRCALHILHLIFQTGLENESISHLFEKIPTQDLSYDKQVCVSRVYPWLTQIEENLRSFSSRIEFETMKVAIGEMVKKFEIYWPKIKEFSILCHSLDPGFKLLYIKGREPKRLAKKILLDCFERYLGENIETDEIPITQSLTRRNSLSERMIATITNTSINN